MATLRSTPQLVALAVLSIAQGCQAMQSESTEAPSPPAPSVATAPKPIGMIWTGPNAWTVKDILGPKGGNYPSLLEQLTTRPWNDYLLGWPGGQKGVGSGAQFYTIAPECRQAYGEAYAAARLKRPTVTLGLYTGTMGRSPYTFDVSKRPDGAYEFFDFFDPYARAAKWDNVIKPWVDLLHNENDPGSGLRDVWWDGGSALVYRKSAQAWIKWLQEEHGIGGGIEALALTRTGELDPAMVSVPQMGMMACVPDKANPGKFKISYGNPNYPKFFAPPGSRMYLFVIAHAGPGGPETILTPEILARFVRRGFGLMPDQPHDEAVKRAYALAGVKL